MLRVIRLALLRLTSKSGFLFSRFARRYLRHAECSIPALLVHISNTYQQQESLLVKRGCPGGWGAGMPEMAGGLDSSGGQNNHKTGEYHCHREPCFSLQDRKEQELPETVVPNASDDSTYQLTGAGTSSSCILCVALDLLAL